MYIDPNLITNSIVEAYDTFAALGFEKDVVVQVYDLDTLQISTDYTIKALWLNKDTVKVNDTNFLFMTESHPSMYIKLPNMPDDQSSPSGKLEPNNKQRLFKMEDPDRQFSIDSINKIFNFVVLRLKQ